MKREMEILCAYGANQIHDIQGLANSLRRTRLRRMPNFEESIAGLGIEGSKIASPYSEYFLIQPSGRELFMNLLFMRTFLDGFSK